ncbi:hypothetical protein BDZ91DRAFT_756379 [Kalaharituber pfeilii]|nr:hypothetical protein BDZ91DRAFT_756379 [Kalaharituber pfeilii]
MENQGNDWKYMEDQGNDWKQVEPSGISRNELGDTSGGFRSLSAGSRAFRQVLRLSGRF